MNIKCLTPFLLIVNFAFCQEIKVYNESIYISENQILYNKISYSIENNTKETLLFYKSKQDFRFNSSSLVYNKMEFHNNIRDFEFFLSPKLMIYNSRNEGIYEDEPPPFPNHSLAVFNEKEKNYYDLNEKEKMNYFFKERLIILNPNDIYFFVGYVALPEHETFNNMDAYRYTLKRNEKYFFKIQFEQSKEYIETILPKYYLKKLQKEKVAIFDGVLISNEGFVEWVKE